MTDYPNQEHANLDAAARSRALKASGELEGEIRRLKQSLGWGGAGDDGVARRLADQVAKLTENVVILATLRDVREWHEADKAARTLPDGYVRAAFDPRDPVSILRALRDTVGEEMLRVVADAEKLR